MPNPDLKAQLLRLGVQPGDTLLARAALQRLGLRGPRDEFLQTLLELIGPEGTLVSLAFTPSDLLWRLDRHPPFSPEIRSYAGAFPNSMLAQPQAQRSQHPQASFVAIGPAAHEILADHGPNAPAYLPMQRLVALKAKMLVVGCVDTSPGFTTAHWAEYQLGLHRRVMFPSWMAASRYLDANGEVKTFLRRDPGLCSRSFWKYYGPYVKAGVLSTGAVGSTHGVLAPAAECHAIEYGLLSQDPAFSVCDDYACAACNVLRWDRLHRLPGFLASRVLQRFRRLRT